MGESMAYIARCKCGGWVLAIVDAPDMRADIARETGKAIEQGYTIERVTCEYVRQSWTACKCGKRTPALQAEQLVLI